MACSAGGNSGNRPGSLPFRSVRHGEVEQALEHSGVLLPVAALLELARDVGGDDRGHRFDAVIGSGSGERVPATRADAEQADTRRVHALHGVQERDSALEVLDALPRILEAARHALTFALVRGIERQGDEPSLCEHARVERSRLFLHTTPRMPDDERGHGPIQGIRRVQNTGDVQAI